MTSRIVDKPGFAAETQALLARLVPPSPSADYPALLAARAEPSDPAVSGRQQRLGPAAGVQARLLRRVLRHY